MSVVENDDQASGIRGGEAVQEAVVGDGTTESSGGGADRNSIGFFPFLGLLQV